MKKSTKQMARRGAYLSSYFHVLYPAERKRDLATEKCWALLEAGEVSPELRDARLASEQVYYDAVRMLGLKLPDQGVSRLYRKEPSFHDVCRDAIFHLLGKDGYFAFWTFVKDTGGFTNTSALLQFEFFVNWRWKAVRPQLDTVQDQEAALRRLESAKAFYPLNVRELIGVPSITDYGQDGEMTGDRKARWLWLGLFPFRGQTLMYEHYCPATKVSGGWRVATACPLDLPPSTFVDMVFPNAGYEWQDVEVFLPDHEPLPAKLGRPALERRPCSYCHKDTPAGELKLAKRSGVRLYLCPTCHVAHLASQALKPKKRFTF